MRLPVSVVAVAGLGVAACLFLVIVAAGQGVGQASLWAGVLAALVAIATPVVATWSLAARREVATSARVLIASPEADEHVPHKMYARGSASSISGHISLWLVVKAGRSFYPHGKIDMSAGGGKWVEPVFFGRPAGTVGHEYMLYVVGADPTASSRLEAYLRQKAAGKDVSGLSDGEGTYPDVKRYASVNVIRSLWT